jgi:hypothetical protein
MNEISRAFDQLSTQLALFGQGVKVQALKSIKDLSRHKDSLGLHFGHKWFTHFGFANGFLGLATHFLDEALFQDVMHVDNLPLLGNAHIVLGILFSCVVCRPSYFT